MVMQPPPCLTTEILDPAMVVQEGQPVLDSYPAFSCQFKSDSFGYIRLFAISVLPYVTGQLGRGQGGEHSAQLPPIVQVSPSPTRMSRSSFVLSLAF